MMANFSVPYQVTLGDLLPGMVSNSAIAAKPVFGLDVNSRSVEAGDVFFACPGGSKDGRDYIDDAILRGAAAVVYEAEAGAEKLFRKQDCVDVNQRAVPTIPVSNLSQQLSVISSRYFHAPSQTMRCIGVTGTNGKTSCSYWLAQLLFALDKKPGLIGTLGHQIFSGDKAGTIQETGFTTPDAIFLQRILSGFQQESVTHAVMEVSSHSLDQYRVEAVAFSSALFTNLSRDHLDYHGSMEHYAASKARLFRWPGLKNAIINLDDVYGKNLIEQVSGATVFTYSVSNTDAHLHIKNLALDRDGIRGDLVSPWGEQALCAPVIGEFNISNLLGVIGVLCAEGFSLQKVLSAVKSLKPAPGRMQRVLADEKMPTIEVFVDYAHTPDALEKVLSTLKKQTHGKLWCVFGCGGDRDTGKRALMGQAAAQLADHSVVTSDNPRSENPQAIIKQIVSGMSGEKFSVISDRKQAIKHAIHNAQPGDVVLIAGKGHERYQEINGNRMPFSDVDEAVTALCERRVAGS